MRRDPAADGRELARCAVHSSLESDSLPISMPCVNTHPDSLPEIRGTNSKLHLHTQHVSGKELLRQETFSNSSQERKVQGEESWGPAHL